MEKQLSLAARLLLFGAGGLAFVAGPILFFSRTILRTAGIMWGLEFCRKRLSKNVPHPVLTSFLLSKSNILQCDSFGTSKGVPHENHDTS